MHADEKVLYKVASALLVLLALTVGISFVNLGPLNSIATMGIATLKAFLVVLFFMEVRSSRALIWILSAVGLLWLLILLGGVGADMVTR